MTAAKAAVKTVCRGADELGLGVVKFGGKAT